MGTHGLLYARGCAVAFALAVVAAGCSEARGGKSYADYPEFEEGGTLTLNMQGQPATVQVDYIVYANTDEGYSDYIEIQGPGTFLQAENPNKDLDFDTDTAYQPIVNTPLQVSSSEEKMTVNIPGLGEYPVIGGTLTMQKYVIGRDGQDWWDGTLNLTIETATGPQVVGGTFSFCIVPVW